MPLKLRRLTPEELENVVPAVVANEMPDDPGFGGVRWTLKNLAANPAQAKQVLRASGYHVRPYGEGFNFAVQKAIVDPDTGQVMPPDGNSWKVVDPNRFDDILYDLADLMGDAFVGGVSALGGAFGGPLGAGVGAGVGELMRQGAGELAGIEDNIDVGQAGLTAGLSAAAGPVGKAIGAGFRGAANKVAGVSGELGLSIGSKIMGLKSSPGLLATAALSKRAATMSQRIRMPAIAPGMTGRTLQKGELPEAMEIVDLMRAHMDYTAKHGFKEKDLANGIRDISRAHVRLGPTAMKLFRSSPSGASKVIQKGKRITVDDIHELGNAQNLLDELMTFFKVPQTVQQQVPTTGTVAGFVPNISTKTVQRTLTELERMRIFRRMRIPVQRAHEALESLDHYVDRRSGFMAPGMKPRLDSFTKTVRATGAELRESIRRVLPPEYQQLNTITRVKTTIRDGIRKKVGDEREGAELYLNNFFAAGKTEARRDLEQYDRLWNTNFSEMVELAAVGARFGSKGKPSLVPRLGATGQFLGTNLFAAGTIGAGIMAGGPVGGIAGAMIASPRGVVGLTRAAQGLSRGISRAGGAAGSIRGGSAAGYAGISAASREMEARLAPDKPIARENAGSRQRSKKLVLK